MSTVIKNLKEKLEAGPDTKPLLKLKKILEGKDFYFHVITKDSTGRLNDSWPYSMVVLSSKKDIDNLRKNSSSYHLQIGFSKNKYMVTPVRSFIDPFLADDSPRYYKTVKLLLISDEIKTLKAQQKLDSYDH